MPFFKRIGKLFARKKHEPEAMPEEVRAQVELLTHSHRKIRESAAMKLGNLKHESAVPSLIKALQDPMAHVRRRAAWALGSIKHPAAVPPLIQALNDVAEDTRQEAAAALGNIGDASAVLPLANSLMDRHSLVREYAAGSLGQIGHPSAIPPLSDALHDENEEVRGYAALALGKISRSLKGKTVEGKEAQALQLVAAHFRQNEEVETIQKAFEAALKGKVTKENARLYIKQLRAMKGSLK